MLDTSNMIPIIVVTDDNYAQHLGVMLTSLFENAAQSERVQIHVITAGLSDNNTSKLMEITGLYGANIEFLTVDPSLYSGFGVRNRMSHTAYYKLAIPELFCDRFEKCIFLDCDIIIKADIEELWNIDVSGTAVAAVKQPFFTRHDQLNIPDGSSTFNSGVMVINLRQWVESRVKERAIEFLKYNSHRIVFHDQDALNAVLNDNWIEVNPRWNQLTSFLYANHEELGWSQKQWSEVFDSPAIVHYSSTKPWYYLNDHPYKQDYYDYLIKTPWSNYIPPDQEPALQLMNKKTIVVYGTGSGGDRVHALLTERGRSISYFVDSNSVKWGQAFHEKMVCSPETLLREDQSELAIFIASYSYYTEIAKSLEGLGFRENEHFIAGFGRR
ncbi:glycosyltransferase family 8 protein [Paenibacillus sp. OV219]|uniref:glycosyltransferase family 8 protein n=1 Tax=Paenibacillus sp. OV219 TaxID=1884377 RepID=UPI0008AAFE3C|nr:glycosyltransferase family 8 protein [Paenibacillus sp. OV219]SEN65207.1 Lipopolysaccharide biosynthesis protein, LPS:glycosyltransferase [Paenibacillus sp. OV219]